jgi:uncharacterized membrane protein
MDDCMQCHRSSVDNLDTCETCHVPDANAERREGNTTWRVTHGAGWEQTMPPMLPNGAVIDESVGSCYNISGDGSTVVGLYWAQGGRAYASKWTADGGMVNLGSQAVTHDSRANAVNHDGSVIVGWSANPDSSLWQPTVWEDGALTVLNYTGAWCEAKAVNPDGDIIVGNFLNTADNIVSGAMWVKSDTTWSEYDLGYLPGTFQNFGQTVPWDLTSDGTVVVGTNWMDNWTSKGFVWTQEQGIMVAEDYLAGFGIAVPDSFVISELSAISDNGAVISGITYNRFIFPREYHSFLAELDFSTPVRDVPAPADLTVGQPYPNPFNPATNISLALKQDSWIRLDICDARGRLVRVLHDGILTAGNHVMRWDGQTSGGRTAASGLYLARIRDESGISQTRRMMLIK